LSAPLRSSSSIADRSCIRWSNVSRGDALDMRGNDITQAFIQGRMIELDDAHKQLYRQHKERSQQMGQ
jgi:hypothetical protein